MCESEGVERGTDAEEDIYLSRTNQVCFVSQDQKPL